MKMRGKGGEVLGIIEVGMNNGKNKFPVAIDSFYGPVFRPHGRPTARFVGWCLGGVTFVLHLPGQFLRSVSEERAVGLENTTP